jgi:hypothetical protein
MHPDQQTQYTLIPRMILLGKDLIHPRSNKHDTLLISRMILQGKDLNIIQLDPQTRCCTLQYVLLRMILLERCFYYVHRIKTRYVNEIGQFNYSRKKC